MKKFITYFFIFIGICIVSGFIFIHFFTEAAANFSDDILRPLVGNDNIIALERVYFNSIDKVNQIFSVFKKEKSPIINNGDTVKITNNLNKGTLDLTRLPSNAKTLLDNEGIWQDIPLKAFPNEVVMAETFIRPDPSRPYAFVTLVQMDMSKLDLFSVAGTVEPGSKAGNPGPGVIPKDIQNAGKLVAAFDGGFQYRDGQYGMIVGDKTYLPLKNDLATLVSYKNGKIEIVKYEGQDFGKDISFIRQNCPMLIESGVVAANDATNRKLWGRTTTWKIDTWRSGVGVTAKGNLIFAIGNSLMSNTLATALQMGGAVNAMQLDINPNWVRFNIFDNFLNGKYSTKTIIEGIKDGSDNFLHGDKKDFFYLTKKSKI